MNWVAPVIESKLFSPSPFFIFIIQTNIANQIKKGTKVNVQFCVFRNSGINQISRFDMDKDVMDAKQARESSPARTETETLPSSNVPALNGNIKY